MSRLIAIEAIILILQIILYFGCEVFQHNYRDVKGRTDDRIPLIPAFVYLYVLWFPLVALFPIALYRLSAYDYTVYQLSIIISNIMTTVLYVLFPTKFERPVPGDDFFGKSLSFIYSCDFKASNCSPSLHCVQCFIIMTSSYLCPGITGTHESIIIVISAAIVLSTLMTKQHVLRDVTTAVPTAACSYAAGFLITHYFGHEIILSTVGLA